MSAPPQVTANAEGVLRSLSNYELAKVWVELQKEREDTAAVLAEFRRRMWERVEESAQAGTTINGPFNGAA